MSNLCVDVSTMCGTVLLFERTGNVSKKGLNVATLPRKLTGVVELLIMQLVLQHVGVTLTERRKELHYMSGVDLQYQPSANFYVSTISLGKESGS